MKFICEKALLVQALSDSIRAIPSKSPIPALEGFLIKAGQRLEITGYNTEIGIRSFLDADIRQPGALVVQAKLFLDIIRSLPDEAVTVESDENFMTTVSCGASVFNLISTNPADYPELPIFTGDYAISIPSGLLRSMINGTIFSVSVNETKPVITGCKFQFEGNRLTVIAMDHFRFALRRETVEREDPSTISFVVPGRALRELERFLDDSDDPISLAVSKKNIAFDLGGTTLTSQLLEGEFLNYQNALPKAAQSAVQASTAALVASLERTSIVTTATLKNYTSCMFDGSVLRLACTTAIGKAYDECPIETLFGDPLTIGFQSRYLLEALRVIKDDAVKIELGSKLSPAIILPVEGDKFLYFIMPTRLKEN